MTKKDEGLVGEACAQAAVGTHAGGLQTGDLGPSHAVQSGMVMSPSSNHCLGKQSSGGTGDPILGNTELA